MSPFEIFITCISQSYIDTGTLIKLPLSVIDNKKIIGQLTKSDKQRLLDFLNKNIK